jgi:hypothetical protein
MRNHVASTNLPALQLCPYIYTFEKHTSRKAMKSIPTLYLPTIIPISSSFLKITAHSRVATKDIAG